MADPKNQQNEERLRQIAQQAGMTLRELNQLFQLVMIDDEKTRHRIIEQQKQEMQYMQNTLTGLQYRNETLQNKLLTYQLERKVKRMELAKRIRGWLKKKPVPLAQKFVKDNKPVAPPSQASNPTPPAVGTPIHQSV